MWKEENLTGEYITLDGVVESLEIKNKDSLVGALLDYSDYEDYIINNNLEIAHNTKETWMNIACALSGVLELDYTPKGNLQEYADELLDLAKYRIENNVMPNEDFTIPEIIKEVEEKIKVFTRLVYQLKAIDPKVIEETAESFIQKGETEYQKIIENTATNYVERAISNCPECNNTYIDKFTSNKIKTYSYSEVAAEAGEDEQTIINFCKAKGWLNENNEPYNMPDNNYFHGVKLTKYGKDHIVATFLKIKNAEKGMKKSSCGKGE